MVRAIRGAAVLCTAVSVLSFSTSLYAEDQSGKQTFATCSACHLATGEGIPGAFPPLTKLPDLFEQEGGKQYLISVVLQGLSGPITSQGNAFSGYMQAFGPSLSDNEIASVLNYVLNNVAKPPLDDNSPISENDVSIVRAKIAQGALAKSHTLRKALTAP
jgi:mono/diheme cytochrome c family protein|tara:strand:- start:479 stop:958 length:480 start_codon:yes stop_codon:yes gene_type:complete